MTRQQKMMLLTLFIGIMAVLYLAVILRKADASYSCEYEEPKECIPYNQAWVLAEDEEYCEEPEEEIPVPVPTPGLPGNPPTFAGSSTNAPGVCPINNIGRVANINVEVGVPNDGKLLVQWSLPENADRVHILYRQYDEDWKYALLNTPNDGNEEIGGLKNGVNYAFKVAGVRECGVGEYSKEYDPKP